MSTDYTSEVIALEQAYQAMLTAKTVARNEIKRRHRAAIKQETDQAIAEAEYKFAQRLMVEHTAGLPVGVIQDQVLHTKDWNTWRKWRDLAGIKPSRVLVAEAKAEREAAEEREKITFDWRDGVLYVLKNPVTGEKLPHEIAIPYFRESGAYWADGFDRKMWTTLYPDEDTKELVWFADGINQEVKRAIEAGEVEVYNPWTYLNNEDNDDFLDELAEEEKKMYEMNSWINKEGK